MDIPQEIPRSFDFYPGQAELSTTDTKRERNYPENYPDYTAQTNPINSLPASLSRPLNKEQAYQILSKDKKLTREQFEQMLKNHVPSNSEAQGSSTESLTKISNNTIKEMINKIKGSEAVNDILEDIPSTEEVKIEMSSLGNGAVAETLPNGTILINDDIEEVDDLIASRLVHELSHVVDWQEENYLDRPEEKEAFTVQIQYLLEEEISREEIEEMLLPIFNDYKNKADAKTSLDDIINDAESRNKKTSTLLLGLTKQSQAPINIKFTPAEKAIIDKIKATAEKLGIKAFIAGGLIRDRILGVPNEDLDFVTNKNSEQLVAELAKTYKLSNPIKMDRSGASMIFMNGRYIDVIDAEKVFLPAKIKADTSLEQGQEQELSIFMDDAFRRDLTINSLMYGLHSGKLYDPTGKGLSDLQNKIIRTIIDPHLKYRIHAADMLRAIRFYATKPGFQFAPGMLEAMKLNVSRLTPRQRGGDVSSRRISRELRKCKTSNEWAKCKTTLAEIDAYKYIGDEIDDIDDDKKGGIDYDLKK